MVTVAAEPRLLVVGHGHAGGSVAAEAVALGVPTTIWGRRDPATANPMLAHLVATSDGGLNLDTADIHDPRDRAVLTDRLRRFTWIVLANEPAPLDGAGDVDTAVAAVTRLYRTLATAGFTQAAARRTGRSVVRIGSPPGERPAVVLGPSLSPLGYFRMKRELGRAAAEAARQGLNLSTVAPAEIHSPWGAGTASPDPYRLALGGPRPAPYVLDLPSAAVSDVSVGRAVLAALVGGSPGRWYEVYDATLGPGRATVAMAGALGLPAPTVVTWDDRSLRHLLDVSLAGRELDLGLLRRHTVGADGLLAAAQQALEIQQWWGGALLWWAGDAVRQASRAAPARLVSDLVGRLTDRRAAEALAVLLALGPTRSNQQLLGLRPALARRAPAWLDRLDPALTGEQRRQRLDEALRQRAVVLRDGPGGLPPIGPVAASGRAAGGAVGPIGDAQRRRSSM